MRAPGGVGIVAYLISATSRRSNGLEMRRQDRKAGLSRWTDRFMMFSTEDRITENVVARCFLEEQKAITVLRLLNV